MRLDKIQPFLDRRFSALQIIFVHKKQEDNLRKTLIPRCGVLSQSGKDPQAETPS
jgi:hypothetical protein